MPLHRPTFLLIMSLTRDPSSLPAAAAAATKNVLGHGRAFPTGIRLGKGLGGFVDMCVVPTRGGGGEPVGKDAARAASFSRDRLFCAVKFSNSSDGEFENEVRVWTAVARDPENARAIVPRIIWVAPAAAGAAGAAGAAAAAGESARDFCPVVEKKTVAVAGAAVREWRAVVATEVALPVTALVDREEPAYLTNLGAPTLAAPPAAAAAAAEDADSAAGDVLAAIQRRIVADAFDGRIAAAVERARARCFAADEIAFADARAAVLADWLVSPFRFVLLAHVVRGMKESLAALHAAGVLHRDVKAANFVLTRDGVRVVDFGLSALVADARHARRGALRNYPARAILDPTAAAYDASCDVHALACVVFELINGQDMYSGAAAAVARRGRGRGRGAGSPVAAVAASTVVSLRLAGVHPRRSRRVVTELRRVAVAGCATRAASPPGAGSDVARASLAARYLLDELDAADAIMYRGLRT